MRFSINIILSLFILIFISACSSGGSAPPPPTTVTVVGLNFLSILNENFDQVFQENQSDYTASVGFLAKSIQIKATSADTSASITVNDVAIDTDDLSQLIALTEGADTIINIVVTQNTVSKPYTVTISRAWATDFAEQAYIKASNTGTGDKFGYSVALSGDTLAVGAYLEDSSSDITPDEAATDSGAVYVFTRSGSTWIQQAYLKGSNTEAGDNFGISVALSGDTLAVGATGEQSASTGINSTPDDTITAAGAVYVFVRSGTNWSEEAYIKASNTGDQDKFGISVALSGNTLAVGAIGEGSSTTGINSNPDNAASNSGAVYVFTRNDTSWSEQAYIKASNTGISDRFGNSIALSGDTLAVGASEEDTWRGAVYVFTRSDTLWSEQAYLKASNPDILDFFGISVALSGDTLAVGAYLEDSSTEGANASFDDNGLDSGAVYIFVRSDTTWTQQSFIKPFNTSDNDQFGKSVALSGDVLVVGAAREDSSSSGINPGWNDGNRDFGAVYVYTRDGIIWSEQSFIKPSTTVSKDFFGSSVAVAGDTIAVGVPLNSTSAGAVYTFE